MKRKAKKVVKGGRNVSRSRAVRTVVRHPESVAEEAIETAENKTAPIALPRGVSMKSGSAIKYSVQPIEKPEIKFWRTFKPVVVGKGVEKEPVWFCPHSAISAEPEKERLVINYDKCDGCLLCVRESHTGAIKEERETK